MFPTASEHLNLVSPMILPADQETTVIVSGPFKLQLTPKNIKDSSLRLSNIRFVVQDGATLRIDVDSNKDMATTEERNSSPIIFDGIIKSVRYCM